MTDRVCEHACMCTNCTRVESVCVGMCVYILCACVVCVHVVCLCVICVFCAYEMTC